MGNYSEYRNIIDTYLAAKAAAEVKTAERITALEKSVSEAKTDRQTAINTNDLKAYRAANKAINDAQEQIDFINAGADGVAKPDPVEFAEGVHTVQAGILAEAKAASAELLEKLYHTLTEAIRSIKEGNTLLAEYDRKIDKYMRCVGSGYIHGVPDFTDHEDLVNIASAIYGCSIAYKNITGTDPEDYETTKARFST